MHITPSGRTIDDDDERKPGGNRVMDLMFNIGAWYCVVVPFASAAVFWIVAAPMGFSWPPAWPPRIEPVAQVELYLLLTSLGTGLVCLFGTGRRGGFQILCRALLGIFASGVQGFFVLLALVGFMHIKC